MNEMEDDIPVCPECQQDLAFLNIEELNYDGEKHPFEVWRCNNCAQKSPGMQIDYHYPKGMFTNIPA